MATPHKKYPRHVITNQPGLSPEKKLLLLVMHALDNPDRDNASVHLGAYATNGRLAFEAGTSVGAVRNMMAELEADGFVVVNGAKGEHGVKYRRIVCPHPVIDPKKWATQVYDGTGKGRRARRVKEIAAFQAELQAATRTPEGMSTGSKSPPVDGNPEEAACSTVEHPACSDTEQRTGIKEGIDRDGVKNSIPESPGETEKPLSFFRSTDSEHGGTPKPTPTPVPPAATQSPEVDHNPPSSAVPGPQTTPPAAQPTGITDAAAPGDSPAAPTIAPDRDKQAFMALPFANRVVDTFRINADDQRIAQEFMPWWHRQSMDADTFAHALANLHFLTRGDKFDDARHPENLGDFMTRFDAITAALAKKVAESPDADLACAQTELDQTAFADQEAMRSFVTRFREIKHRIAAANIASFTDLANGAEAKTSGLNDEDIWIAACVLAQAGDPAAGPDSRDLKVHVLRRCVVERDTIKLIQFVEQFVNRPLEAFIGITGAQVQMVRQHCQDQVSAGRAILAGPLTFLAALRAKHYSESKRLDHLTTAICEHYADTGELLPLVEGLRDALL
jgi:hypothetical protein